MAIRLQFDRIPPGVEVGPHRHGVETVVYIAGGQLVFEHGDELDRRSRLDAGDVLYEAAAEFHLVRNEGTIDALALLAAVEPDPRRPGEILRRWESAEEPVRRRAAARLLEADGISRRLLVEPGDFGSATFAIHEVEMSPGRADAWHAHPGSEHVIVVFEGRGEIEVNAIGETLEPLKGIRIQAGLPHRVVNTGRTRLRYYVCGTPATMVATDRVAVGAPNRRLGA